MKKFLNKRKIIVLFFLVFNFIFHSKIFSEQLFFTKVNTKEKVIFLTFDDGPGPWTRKVLDVLNKYNVKATFFVLGELVKYRGDILKEVYVSGNEVGTHLYTHKNFYQIQKKHTLEDTKSFLVQEIENSITQIKNTVGIKPKYLRMPHGYYRSWMNDILNKYDLIVVNWSFGCDWNNISSEEMLKKYCLSLQNGGIYLFHDGGKNRERTIFVLENFIRYAQEKGYKFGLLKDYIK